MASEQLATRQDSDAHEMGRLVGLVRRAVQIFRLGTDLWTSTALLHVAADNAQREGMSREAFLELAGETYDIVADKPGKILREDSSGADYPP